MGARVTCSWAQVLAAALGDGASTLLARYVPSEDVVVAAVHAYTPRRRRRADERGPAAANARAAPSLATWRAAPDAPPPGVVFDVPRCARCAAPQL